MARSIVQLLEATSGLTFLDTRDLLAGRPWRPQIEKALKRAWLIVVFWCEHSVQSEEVAREYEFGIENGKAILPLRLDRTELAPKLSTFQAIDFRTLALSGHQETDLNSESDLLLMGEILDDELKRRVEWGHCCDLKTTRPRAPDKTPTAAQQGRARTKRK